MHFILFIYCIWAFTQHITVLSWRGLCGCKVFEQFCSGHFSPNIRALYDILSNVLLRRQRWQQRIDNEAEMKRSRRSAPEAWRSSSDPFFWTLGIPLQAFSAWESKGSSCCQMKVRAMQGRVSLSHRTAVRMRRTWLTFTLKKYIRLLQWFFNAG